MKQPKFTSKEEVKKAYDAFKHKPNAAYCLFVWKEDKFEAEDTVAFFPTYGLECDDEVMYSTPTFDAFLDLMDEDNGEDFYITGVFGFVNLNVD